MRDRVDLLTLTFRLRPDDREQRRLKCGLCGVPVARVRRAGRGLNINHDGSPHMKSCTRRYLHRERSVRIIDIPRPS